VNDPGFYLWYIGIPVVFVLVILYVFRPWARRKYRRDAEIPFREDSQDRDD
jgi:cbb3-type cytochrome oxidase subunit 3